MPILRKNKNITHSKLIITANRLPKNLRKMERPEGFGTTLRNLSNEIINFGSALKNISDQIIQESDEMIQESDEEKYDTDEEKHNTLEEVYARWQSQPATEEQWHEVTQEIQQATAREYKKQPISPWKTYPKKANWTKKISK